MKARTLLMLAAVAAAVASAQASHAAVTAYSNLGGSASQYYGGQNGAETLDDIHLTEGGDLERIVFEYYDPNTGGAPFDATIRIYANPGGNDNDVLPLAGPYTVVGIARGLNTEQFVIPETVTVTSAIWVSVQFTSPTAGLLINGAPDIGVSHDLYVEDGRTFFFSGNPLANFGLEVRLEDGVVSAPPSVVASARLLGAHPNPFNPATRVEFEVDVPQRLSIDVLDLRGRLVRSLAAGRTYGPGRHGLAWNGLDAFGGPVASGVYTVVLRGATTSSTQISLIK